MSPSGFVIESFIFTSLIILLSVGCTPHPYSASCPKDWSLDPVKRLSGSAPKLHCWTSGSPVPSSCDPTSCVSYPVCEACTDLETGDLVEQITCTKEYHAGDGQGLQTICIDSNERYLTCSGTCTGSLTCSQCQPDSSSAGTQSRLQRRANPFNANMDITSGSHGGSGFFGESFNLRN